MHARPHRGRRGGRRRGFGIGRSKRVSCVTAHDPQLARLADAIAQRVGQQRFHVWFNNSTRLDLRNDGLEIAVPNDFISEWIGRNFTRPIQEAAHEVLGCSLSVRFSVVPQLFDVNGDDPAGGNDEGPRGEPAEISSGRNGYARHNGNGNGNGHNGHGTEMTSAVLDRAMAPVRLPTLPPKTRGMDSAPNAATVSEHKVMSIRPPVVARTVTERTN